MADTGTLLLLTADTSMPMSSHSTETMFISLQLASPRIAGPSDSAMYRSRHCAILNVCICTISHHVALISPPL